VFAFAAQCSNHVAERRERAIDLFRFFETLPGRAGFFHALRTGQIDQIQTGLHFLAVARVLARNEQDEDRVRSGRALVAVRRRRFAPLVGALHQIRELVLRSDLVPAQIRHVDVFRASSFDFQLFIAA
jgi:hypothetical protein